MKLKMKPTAELTLDSGEVVQVERIGRGRYTTAWRNSHNVYLQVKEIEDSKEILASLATEPRNQHIPDCKFLAWADNNSPYRWYRMPLYQPLTAKSGKAWEDFKLIKSLRDETNNERVKGMWSRGGRGDMDATEFNALFNDKVQDATYLSDALKEAIQQLVDEACNYGQYMIEITKKNCAVDNAGNLILLDPLFDYAEVKAARDRQMKR